MISQNLRDLLLDATIDLSTKNEVLLDAAGYTKVRRGKHSGKYQCPCCGEIKLSVKGGKGTTCFGCGAGATDVFRQLKRELGLDGQQRSESKFEKYIPAGTSFGKKEEIVLAVRQWNDAIANLMNMLPLTVAHKKYLIQRRGMTEEAIAKCSLFSIPDYEFDVTGAVPDNFPGTRWKEDSNGIRRQYLQPRRTQDDSGQWHAHSQIFHVARGPMGDYIGGQALCPEIERLGIANKYRNLIQYDGNASNSKVIYHTHPEQFFTYETSFNSGDRDRYPGHLFLVDSDAGKPTYASRKHGISVAGMRAANFHNSPELLFSLVLIATQVQGKKAIVFAPDYGDFPCAEKPDGNLNMIRNWVEDYLEIRAHYPHLPVQVRVANGCDLDEDDEVGYQFIPFLDYLAIAQKSSKKVRRLINSLTTVGGLLAPVMARVSEEIKSRTACCSAIVPASFTNIGGTDNLLAPRCDLIPESIEFTDDLDFTDLEALYDHAVQLKMDVPKIRFAQQSDRRKLLASAAQSNWKYISDTTRTGGGKTWDALNSYDNDVIRGMLGADGDAIMQVGSSDNNRIFYLCPSPLNVPVDNEFSLLQSRTEGLHIGKGDRLYAQPKKDTVPHPLGYGNCGMAAVHRMGLQNSMPSDQLKEIICTACPAYDSCKEGGVTVRAHEVEGLKKDLVNGYLGNRIAVLEEATQIIAHPSQLPHRSLLQQQRGVGPGDMMVLDDVRLKTQHDISVGITEIDLAIATATTALETEKLRGNEFSVNQKQRIYDKTVPVLVVLKNLLKSFDSKKYSQGWTPKILRDRMKTEFANQGIDIANIFGNIELCNDREPIELEEGHPGWVMWDKGGTSVAAKRAVTTVGDIFNNTENLRTAVSNSVDPSDCEKAMRDHGRVYWVGKFFRSFSDTNLAVSIAVESGQPVLKINAPDNSQASRIKSAGLVVNMDATSTPGQFAQVMEIGRSRVLHIEQVPPDHSNLTHINIVTKQKFTRQRWGNIQLRELGAIARTAQERFGATAFITHKRQVEEKVMTAIPDALQGYWRNDNRGTNKYQDCAAIIMVGNPIANMNGKASELQAETGYWIDHSGNNSGQFFYRLRKDATEEVLQAIGRLRANRTDSPKTSVSVGIDLDREAMLDRFPGMTIVDMTVEEFCGESIRNWVADNMISAIAHSLESGLRPVQNIIAESLEVTDRTLRNKCQQYGGYRNLVRMVKQLMSMTNGNRLSAATEQMANLAKQVVPEKFREWRDAIAQAELIAREASLWTGERLQEIADRITTASVEAIACLTELSPKKFEQAVGCMDLNDQQTLWEIILSLEPVNFERLRLWEKPEILPKQT